MRLLFALSIIFSICSIDQKIIPIDHTYILGKANQEQDTLTWIEHFREFRNALYQNDRMKVKSFIDFPIMNENNEIWYLAYNGDVKAAKLLSAKIKPFTEKDLDRYFDNLFSKQLVKNMLKINTAELYKNGETQGPELKEGKTTYTIIAAYEKATNKLSLNLTSKTKEKDAGGETLDGGEFSVIYFFDILTNGQLKFRQVRIAG